MRQKLGLSLGQCTTVFQAELYALRTCVVENLDKNYTNRNIYILSDSQAVAVDLRNHQMVPKLVRGCHQSSTKLAEHNTVQLMWVSGHEVTEGNEMADQLAKQGTERPFTGSKPACGISTGVSKRDVRD